MRQLDHASVSPAVDVVLKWARRRAEVILDELGGDPEEILDFLLARLAQGEFPILDGSAAANPEQEPQELAPTPVRGEDPEHALARELQPEQAPEERSRGGEGIAQRVLAELGAVDEGHKSVSVDAVEDEDESSADPLAALIDLDSFEEPEPPLLRFPDDDEDERAAEEAVPSTSGSEVGSGPGVPADDDDEPVAGVPADDDEPVAGVPADEDEPVAGVPADDDEPVAGVPADDDDEALGAISAVSDEGSAAARASILDELGPPLLPDFDESGAGGLALEREPTPLPAPPSMPSMELSAGAEELPQPAPDDRWSAESDWSDRSFLIGIPDDETIAAAAAELRREGPSDGVPVARRRDPSSQKNRAAVTPVEAPAPAPPGKEKGKKSKGKSKPKEKTRPQAAASKAVLLEQPRSRRRADDSRPVLEMGGDGIEELEADEIEELDAEELEIE